MVAHKKMRNSDYYYRDYGEREGAIEL